MDTHSTQHATLNMQEQPFEITGLDNYLALHLCRTDCSTRACDLDAELMRRLLHGQLCYAIQRQSTHSVGRVRVRCAVRMDVHARNR